MRSTVRNETVEDFDVDRYLGRWYEIGKYPNIWFEKDCSSAIAKYTLNNDGTIKAENSCLDKNDNVLRTSIGRARIVDSGKLKVKFQSTPEQPAMPFEGDYWLHYTDYNKFAIVGEPTGNMLWVLSRMPQISARDAVFLTRKIKYFGYNPDLVMINKKFIKN